MASAMLEDIKGGLTQESARLVCRRILPETRAMTVAITDAVSYTHLDVYKRQSYVFVVPDDLTSSATDRTLAIASQIFAYTSRGLTHCLLYTSPRPCSAACCSPWASRCSPARRTTPCPCSPRSPALVDVYKRQPRDFPLIFSGRPSCVLKETITW